MKQIDLNKVRDFIDNNIDGFHQARLDSIKKLKLNHLLARKNPYLFKAKNVTTADELVRNLLDAHLSSQEEGMFGTFLEKLAIFVCKKTFGGYKSPGEGIDLDFERDGKRYLVSIKSGPNWGNSDQIKKMKDNFRRAKKVIGQPEAVCVNGCCYGKSKSENKGDYVKKCGQSFWELISGDPEFYKNIIEPLGHKAKKRNDEFMTEYGKVINRFSKEFMQDYCAPDGAINWDKIVEFNSAINKPKNTKCTPKAVKTKPV